ncbi:GTP pyrophosphokinase [Priestia filamentosa]|uniref:GTP pyrophosphokinase n=1 Tax=Priestia filamentosa TaxID=1402861 RepID=UPI00397E3E05
MQALLEKAIELAVHYHGGQTDKGGNPYILHPLAVMTRVKSIEEKIVAVLHDIVEDTPLTFDGLRDAGFPDVIIEAVDALTKRAKESYNRYIWRVKNNSLACAVKLADLSENMDLSRIPFPQEKDFLRIEKYAAVREYLIGKDWIYENKKWIKK